MRNKVKKKRKRWRSIKKKRRMKRLNRRRVSKPLKIRNSALLGSLRLPPLKKKKRILNSSLVT